MRLREDKNDCAPLSHTNFHSVRSEVKSTVLVYVLLTCATLSRPNSDESKMVNLVAGHLDDFITLFVWITKHMNLV